MRDNQLLAGLIAHTLLFSIGANYKFGKEARAKLGNAFRREFKKQKLSNKNFDALTLKGNDIFEESWKEFENGIEISIAKVVYFMVVQNEDLFKPFKINKKHLEAINRASNVEGLGFDSLKVCKSLIKHIGEANFEDM